MNILALKVGVSSVTAAVLDVSGAVPAGSAIRVDFLLDCPTPEVSEVSAHKLWQAVALAARRAVSDSGVSGQNGQDVEAVGFCCFSPGLVLLDTKDRPLNAIMTDRDRRARPAARQIWAAVGEEFLDTTGNRSLPGKISAVGFRQMLSQDPYLLHSVRSYLHVQGWLGFRMTGEKAFDPANASCTGLFETVKNQRWSHRWCDYFEVDPHWLPQVLPANATLGTLRAEAAAELGVPAGIPCKVGCPELTAAILGAGIEPGDLLHELGEVQLLSALTEKAVPGGRRLTRQLGVGSLFVQQVQNPVSLQALAWVKNLCFREQSEDEFYAKTVPQALARATRVTLDPPYLAGDSLAIEAQRGALRDLELATDRHDLLAAVLNTMKRGHQEAITALGRPSSFRHIYLAGQRAEWVRSLLPEYHAANVQEINDGSLCGITKLFQTSSFP